MNFSVAIIAKNGAATLPKLFAGLQLFIDAGGEVVLLDTGSDDGTMDVARAHGCRVYERKFNETIDLADAYQINNLVQAPEDAPVVTAGMTYFNFAAARNEAARHCKNTYVLVLDCDVVLDRFDYERICETIRIQPADVYYAEYDFGHMKTSNIFLYNQLTQQYVGVVHEVVEPMGDAPRVDGKLSKGTFAPRHEADNKSRAQYLTGLAHQWYKNQDNPRCTYYFGRELFYRKMYEPALRVLGKRFTQVGWDAERSDAAVLAGHCAWNLGGSPADWYAAAFEVYPHRRAPLLSLAEFYLKQKRWQKCAAYAAAAMEVKWVGDFNDFSEHYTHVPYGLRYVARYNGNLDLKGAEDDFWKAYAIAPHLYEGDKHLFEKKQGAHTAN